MYPQSEESSNTSGSPTISVTVTALSRPSSLLPNISTVPSTPNSSLPLLDTPTITNIVLSSLEGGIQSGVPTRTTATLTPTTLKNIEQLLEVPTVQPPEVHFNQAGFVPPPVQITTANSTYISVDNKAWGGGVTTLTQPTSVSPVPSNRGRPASSPSPVSLSSSEGNRMPSISVPVSSQGQQPPRRTGGRRPLKDEKLSPEEEERRLLRRERNKQAAARCRKRRLDQTNRLQDETDVLEEKRESLQQEIQILQQQREELEFLLAAHKTSCKRAFGSNSTFSSVEIKLEPADPFDEPVNKGDLPSKPTRPTSLALGTRLGERSGGVTDLGISIETPSNELRGMGFSFESMIEPGSGLTPVNTVIAPISTGLTPLSTPVVTTAPSSNCGTQQRSSSTDLSSPDSVPPKLVSL